MTLNELFKECTIRNPKDGPYELPYETWLKLYEAMKQFRDEEEKPFLSASIDRPNFLCGGVPVVVNHAKS